MRQGEEVETRTAVEAGGAERGAPLVAELEGYREQYEAIKLDARELVEGLTDAQFNWRTAPGQWSIAECLAHLNLTGQMFLPLIDRHIRRAREAGLLSAGPYRHPLGGRLFLRAVEPPVKRVKVKAPKTIAPPPEHLLHVVVPAFMSLQEQMLRRLREADGLDLGRVRMRSPFTKLIRYSLGQSLALVAAHERRHLWQARRVREHADFPKA